MRGAARHPRHGRGDDRLPRRGDERPRRPQGTWLGLADGEAVAGGADFEDVAVAVADKLLAEPRGVMTLLTGADKPELDGVVKRIEERHPELELDVQSGGQPHYPLLLSAE